MYACGMEGLSRGEDDDEDDEGDVGDERDERHDATAEPPRFRI